MLMSRSDRLAARCTRTRRALLLVLAVALPILTVLTFSPRVPAQEAELAAENAALRAQVSALNAQIAKLTVKIDVLAQKLAMASNERASLLPPEAPKAKPDAAVVALDDVTNEAVIKIQVSRGATLQSIARSFGTDEQALIALNPELRAGQLRPGMTLLVPSGGRGAEAERVRVPTEGEWHRIARPAPAAAPRSVAWPRASQDPTVDLATRLIEARGELDIAKRELGLMTQRFEAGRMDQLELVRVQARAETAKRKLEVIAAVVKAEIVAADSELAAVRSQWEKSGSDSDALMWKSSIVRLENRIKILASVLK